MKLARLVISTLIVILLGDLGFILYQEQQAHDAAQDFAINDVFKINQAFGATTQLIAGTTYTLSGSGISSSASSIGLTSLTLPQNGYKIQDSDVSSTFYVTIDPGSRTRQELASCTTVTQNAGGSATLSGCTRGLSPISPYTASSTLQFSHAGGSQMIFSNPPQVYEEFAAKGNNALINGLWKFNGSLPIGSGTATSTSQLATRAYADGVALAGAPDASTIQKGVVEEATQTEVASSTSVLTTTAHGFIRNTYATSSPDLSSGAATRPNNYLPVSESDGKLNQGWLRLGDAFRFTASTTVNGVASFASTLVAHAAAIINGILTWNGVSYTGPSSQGAANTVMTNNGSGTLSWTGIADRKFIPCLANKFDTASAVASSSTSVWGTFMDQNTNDWCVANFVLPPGKSISRFHIWGSQSNGSPGTGNVVLETRFMPMTSGATWGLTPDDSGQTVTGVFSGNNNMAFFAPASTSYDGITTGKPYLIQLRRPANTSDTLTSKGIRISGIDYEVR